MKLMNNFLMVTALIVFVGCSSATRTTAENLNTNLPNISSAAPTPTPAAENQTAKTAPDALVKDLYQQHDAQKSPFYQSENRALVDKYFDKNLAEMIWKEAREPKDGVGALDGDPLYDAQDTDIKKFAVGKPQITGDKAEVVVSFENFKKPTKFTYLLVKQNGDWKISDIKYGEGRTGTVDGIDFGDGTLTQIYRNYEKSMSEPDAQISGEFEGRYQIGETTCTVKPVKMAFEIKWEKGKGVEMFFFQDRANDKYIFASDPPKGKANVFSFDDENFNTGIFYRADGREFPISRIK